MKYELNIWTVGLVVVWVETKTGSRDISEWSPKIIFSLTLSGRVGWAGLKTILYHMTCYVIWHVKTLKASYSFSVLAKQQWSKVTWRSEGTSYKCNFLIYIKCKSTKDCLQQKFWYSDWLLYKHNLVKLTQPPACHSNTSKVCAQM